MSSGKAGLGKLLCKLLGERLGSSAVEFAIVAPVFITLMLSTFEVAWYYFVNASLDAASLSVARYIRTGQAQLAGYTGQTNRDLFFSQQVCPKLSFLVDCASRVTLEVRTYSSFAALAADTSTMACRDDNPATVNNLAFDPGSDDSIVRIRMCMIYDTLNPAIGLNLSKNAAGQRKIMSTYILRVEPYSKNV